MAYRKGDVVLVPFPFTDLSSAKTRPAAVVSVPDFERATGDVTVAMITSVPQGTPYDSELVEWRKAQLLFPSWVRAKVATLSPKLVRHRVGRLSPRDLVQVEQRLRRSFGL
jgi:mRNA interferase MazF